MCAILRVHKPTRALSVIFERTRVHGGDGEVMPSMSTRSARVVLVFFFANIASAVASRKIMGSQENK